MARVKVYGALTLASPAIRQALETHHVQCRQIVAATSQRAAAEAMGVTLREFRFRGSETFNDVEVGLAMAKPGTVFVADLNAPANAENYITVPEPVECKIDTAQREDCGGTELTVGNRGPECEECGGDIVNPDACAGDHYDTASA